MTVCKIRERISPSVLERNDPINRLAAAWFLETGNLGNLPGSSQSYVISERRLWYVGDALQKNVNGESSWRTKIQRRRAARWDRGERKESSDRKNRRGKEINRCCIWLYMVILTPVDPSR
ncbi:hypothetical protein ACS0PU_006601 [Formica fusca]